MFKDSDLAEYQVNSVLAWTHDSLFQAENVKCKLANYNSNSDAPRWILRCAIYHWLVSTNKLLMALERNDHEPFIREAIGVDLLEFLKNLKPFRAIWEHDFDHLSDKGNYQKKFIKPVNLSQAGLAEDQLIAATQLTLPSGRLMIGGRLDFECIIDAVKDFDERLLKEYNRQNGSI